MRCYAFHNRSGCDTRKGGNFPICGEREKENCIYSRPIIRNGEHSVFILFSGLPYFDIDNNNSTINENPCIMKTCMNRTSTLRRQCPKYFCSSVRQSVSQSDNQFQTQSNQAKVCVMYYTFLRLKRKILEIPFVGSNKHNRQTASQPAG